MFGDHVLIRGILFKWNEQFSGVQKVVEDGERPGRPVATKAEERVQKINEISRKSNV